MPCPPFRLYKALQSAQAAITLPKSSSHGEYDGFKANGVQSFDNLLVSSHLNAEDEQQHPDQQGDDLGCILLKFRFRKR